MREKREQTIGIFNDSFPPIYDGVTLTVQNYCRYLAEKGHKVTVVTPWNPERGEYPFDILRYFSLPIRSRKPYRYGYPKLDPFIWRQLSATPFRLVHSHCPFSSGRLGVYVKKKQHVPLIATFHSKYRDDLMHSFRHFPFCVDIIMKRILDFFNACDEVWIPQAQVEETVREYGYKGKLTVVENGIDISEDIADIPRHKSEAKRLLGIPQQIPAFLFVGQHIKEKGVDVILDTLGLLGHSMDFRMSFIGNGYALEEMKKRVAGSYLADKVIFHGIITDREELKKHYAAADLFIFPSLYDNAPLVVREAASFATPAILIKGSTAAEVIADGFNGFTTARDPHAIAEKIAAVCADPAKLLATGINARNTIVRSWEDVVAEVEDRYRAILRKYK